jgi:hypothetical protein
LSVYRKVGGSAVEKAGERVVGKAVS